WIEGLLRDAGVAADWIPYLRLMVLLVLLAIILYVSFLITRRYFIRYLHAFFKQTSATWDDVLADNKTFENLAHLVPALIVKIFAPILFRDFVEMLQVFDKMIYIYLLTVGIIVLVMNYN